MIDRLLDEVFLQTMMYGTAYVSVTWEDEEVKCEVMTPPSIFLLGKAVEVGTKVRLSTGEVLPIEEFSPIADSYPVLLIDEDGNLLLPHVSDILEVF